MLLVVVRCLLSNVCSGHLALSGALGHLADKRRKLGCLLISWLFHSDLGGTSLRILLSMTWLMGLNWLFCLKTARAARTLVKLLVYFAGLCLWRSIFLWPLRKFLYLARILFLIILNVYRKLLGSCLLGAWASHMGIRNVNLSLVEVFTSRDVSLRAWVVVNFRIFHAVIRLDTCIGLGMCSGTLLRFLRVRWL